MRKAGWYWVRGFEECPWECSYWDGQEWDDNGLDFDPGDLGPRIPAPDDLERLRETARLAERFARAKGRHHSQHAACDLMQHFGLPCVRPGGEGG